MLSSSTLVWELSSSVTCSSLTLISKLLFSSVTSWFCALQMFDSQRSCVAPSGPPAVWLVSDCSKISAISWWLTSSCLNVCGLDVPQPVLNDHSSVAFSSPSCLFLSFFRYSLSIGLNPSIFKFLKSSFFSLMASENCLLSSAKGWLLCKICEMHRQKPCQSDSWQNQNRRAFIERQQIQKLEFGISCDKLLSHLTN